MGTIALTLTLAVVAFVGAVLISAIGNQTATEFRAWHPRLLAWLIDRAVVRLPTDEQERMREEWTRDISDLPGQFFPLWYAFDLRRAARQMAAESEWSWSARVVSRTSGYAIIGFARVGFWTMRLTEHVFGAPIVATCTEAKYSLGRLRRSGCLVAADRIRLPPAASREVVTLALRAAFHFVSIWGQGLRMLAIKMKRKIQSLLDRVF